MKCSAFAGAAVASPQRLRTRKVAQAFTLACYVHAGQSQACAYALEIHRNSLCYRLEQIAEVGELDPLHLLGMLSLYLGLQLLPAD